MAGAKPKDKLIKKDQSAAREIRQEIGEETRTSATKPLQKQPNRDRARGDWDRTGDRHDEGASRFEED